MPNLAKCYQTQSCQKWSYVYRILTNASREYIRKCSCHLRAFRATADVANYGKSVIVPKVAIFGNLWEAGFAIFGKLYGLPELERKIWQCIRIAKNGKTCWAKLPFLATLFTKSCQKWQLLVTPKLLLNIAHFNQ